MPRTFDDLVLELGAAGEREATILELRAAGEAAKPALLRGMDHPAWRVRHGCLRVLDHTVIDDATRRVVLRAIDDPHRKVRTAARHVLGCEVCKPEGYGGIDGVDFEELALHDVLHDRSRRVRLHGMGSFLWRSSLDERVVQAMRGVLAADGDDVELRLRAARVLAFPQVAHLPKGEDRRVRFEEAVTALLEH